MNKKLLIKRERVVKDGNKKIIITKFEKHLVDISKDFSTQFGMIKKKDFSKNKIKVGKEEFLVLDTSFIDHYKKIKRLAQIITLKDIGSIIANTGMNNESVVMEAGTGSAGLSCFLSKLVKKIISYDNRKEHQAIAAENISTLGITNIELKLGDIYKGVKEKEVDILVLDVTEPWNAIKTAEKVLKKGGFVVAYTPSINQAQNFVKSLTDNFLYEKTIENMEREWTIKDEVLRPRMKDIGHTAFLSFARRIK
jgi:tRNA (adenine57-N1/adenine58-N1)-methyltransferase catalytic subunit